MPRAATGCEEGAEQFKQEGDRLRLVFGKLPQAAVESVDCGWGRKLKREKKRKEKTGSGKRAEGKV